MKQEDQEKRRRGRRRWSAEEKVNVLRSHFGRAKIVETCEEFRVHPNMLAMWWKTAVEAAANAFSGDGRRESRAVNRRQQMLESELEKKNRIIAELASEVLELKKRRGET